jgi:hypothetical protein
MISFGLPDTATIFFEDIVVLLLVTPWLSLLFVDVSVGIEAASSLLRS